MGKLGWHGGVGAGGRCRRDDDNPRWLGFAQQLGAFDDQVMDVVDRVDAAGVAVSSVPVKVASLRPELGENKSLLVQLVQCMHALDAVNAPCPTPAPYFAGGWDGGVLSGF